MREDMENGSVKVIGNAAARASGLDPAVEALFRAHPEGPPSVVQEPRDPEFRIIARSSTLERLGMRAAVRAFPQMFTCDRRRARG